MKRPRPRAELEDLTPYRTSGTSGGKIFLHANENPYPPPDAVMDEIADATRKLALNRYPRAEATDLVEQIADYAGVDPSWVWIGDGSNEVLLQACLAYGGPGRTALIFEPTYVMHFRQARMAGTDVIRAKRSKDFVIDPDDAVRLIETKKPDVVFVCTPNNPTGTVTPRADIERIAEAALGLVLVDEAYYEFSEQTLVPDVPSNVLVVRTLSKAFRLANVRLGYGIADPALLEEMRRVRMPYGQSGFTQLAATVALRRRAELLDAVPTLIAERDRVAKALSESAEVFPSGANFVLFRPANAEALLKELDARGIVIRDFRQLEGCEGCLRVSAGTPEENDAFLEAVAATS